MRPASSHKHEQNTFSGKKIPGEYCGSHGREEYERMSGGGG